jgi:hypothetical protein
MTMFRQIILNYCPKWLLNCYFERLIRKDCKKWLNGGATTSPPHGVKKVTVRNYQKMSGYGVLVETGTYHGAMVFAQLDYFKSIYSVELAGDLYKQATKRFKKYHNVHLYHGDSTNVLPDILKCLAEPAIFWLDGHYSGGETAKGEKDCPVWAELEHILDQNLPHIILIDDARCFVGQNDYPAISELQQYLMKKNRKHSFEVKDDIIRIVLNYEIN